MGHDATEEFCCCVIYQNAAVVETKQLGASNCTRTQFADVSEKMYVKIGRGGVKAYGGYVYPQIRVDAVADIVDEMESNPDAFAYTSDIE